MLQAPPSIFALLRQQRNAIAGHGVQGEVRGVSQQRCRPVQPAPKKSQRQGKEQPEYGEAQEGMKRSPVAPRGVEHVTQRV